MIGSSLIVIIYFQTSNINFNNLLNLQSPRILFSKKLSILRNSQKIIRIAIIARNCNIKRRKEKEKTWYY